jgi:hypothetical protein
MESAPQAPVLPQLEWIDASQVKKPRRWPASNNRRTGRLTLIGGVGAISIVALLLVTLLPVVGQHQQSAAAAELHQIAINVADRPVPELKRDQWLETKQLVSFSMDVKWIGSATISGAVATVTATQTEWSNNFGESCTLSGLGRAQFASSAAEATWTSVGLLVDPIQPPISPCSGGGGASASNGDSLFSGSGATDVSSLPTDGSVLAHELNAGTTGISGLDHLGSGTAEPGFQRAVALLVGPLTGTSPAFDTALYDALALLPGIRALGTTATHSGSTGAGFESAGAGHLGPTVIVVDPQTGALLEARNLGPGLFDPLASFVPLGLGTHGVGGNGGNKIQWIDPIGSPAVVDRASIPSSLSPSPPPTAVIVAIGKRGVSAIALNTLQGELYARLGAPGEGSGYGSATGGGVMTFTFDGPRSQVQDYATALRHSDLVASVRVNFGDK